MIRKLLYRPFFIKLFNWEYWPFYAVYGPLFIYWGLLCIRARSFFFFNTSNPGILNGGFLMESKKDIYDLLPETFYPPTLFYKAGTNARNIISDLHNRSMQYPLVGKPDIGMKGLAVKKLNNEQELIRYSLESKVDFLVQEFVPYEKEVGIFYYRFPNEKKGRISGIVLKEFLEVEGDGYSSIIELLKKDKRFILQIPSLIKTYGTSLEVILNKGEKKVLVPYGNHARGAKFLDISSLIDEQLTNTIDSICSQVKGFYYGRLDIRFHSWNDLKEGRNFSIIELNGAGSEPTHIYDPCHSVFYAWKEIIKHWNILWKISKMNHKKYKLPYMNMNNGLEMFRQNKAYLKMITPV